MNKDNAVAEALERLAAKVRLQREYADFREDMADLGLIAFRNLPTIIAALKAQRVDEGWVS